MHEVPTAACPSCGMTVDRAGTLLGQPDDDPPRAGDWIICFGCAATLLLTPELRPRLPSAAELAALDDETRQDLALIRDAVMTAHAERGQLGRGGRT